MKFAACVCFSVILTASTVQAAPFISATPTVLPSGNVGWSVMFNGNDGQTRSSAVDLMFSGAIVQNKLIVVPGVFEQDIDTAAAAALQNGQFGYSSAEDSWLYTEGGSFSLALPSTFPSNVGGGIGGMTVGSTEAFMAFGNPGGTGVEDALLAYFVIDTSIDPFATLNISGNLARAATDFPVQNSFTYVVPEPSSLAILVMGTASLVLLVVSRRT